ncbi:hypothetical protein CANINC_001235 [Pichia inconspicua]|uniref:NmrA-like domain-containing protein n=1 Tax=Pichia inconspicua TaxID=52247 RepID=A0A4T0X486_9ASCO|nr:hypothetical protein CANINC_001235 [[Candida] inconspicua]
MSIAVTGATGQLGKFVIETLLKTQEPENIVALVRNVEKAQELKDQGIIVREFDYGKPEILVPALKGVKNLLLISSNNVGHRVQEHKNVVDAAKKAGVQFFAYTSLLAADTCKHVLAEEHTVTEDYIKESGISYSLLRNGWYFSNYFGAVPYALQSGVFIGAAKDAKINAATRLDYAEAAVKVLTTKGHDNKIYELAGSNYFTLTDFAKALSDVSGKEIKYVDLPAEKYSVALTSHGIPELYVKVIVQADILAIDGMLFDDSKTMEKLIGRPTTPLSEAIKEAVA